MEKLNKTFKINPLYESDGYKVGHKAMLAENTSIEYWTWIPRSIKYMHPSIDGIMSAGEQLVWRYIHSNFQELFFDQPVEVAERFGRDMSKYLMMDYEAGHFSELHKLGYLPVKIKAIPEGTFTKPNIPHMTGINTVDGYAWLGLYLETLVSKLAWQLPTAATIAHRFKQNAVEWVTKTDPENLWLADFMCHDFHSRGGNPFTSIAVGLGHAMSNSGSDTLNVIPASRYYYDFDENDVPVYSVNASEHSVTCTGIFFYEKKLKSGLLNHEILKYYESDSPSDGSIDNPDYLAIAELLNLRDWLKKFPKGILSVVSDTMDLWKVITHILPRLKKEILARDGKLVIRPDSGDPVDIICGINSNPSLSDRVKDFKDLHNKIYGNNVHKFGDKIINESEFKGVIELLWNIFGGTINEQGFKVLDPHIGAIYGDSINLERQIAIYTRLASKIFASTNIVVGVGSYTYVMLTRDSAGYAAKGSWFSTKEFAGVDPDGQTDYITTEYNIYKDPITDNGTKKSLKGFCQVFNNRPDALPYEIKYDGKDQLEVNTECTKEQEESGLLVLIYEDGKFHNQVSLTEIRERLKIQ
jgi:nicotinamide phosphoribosyltransferase